MIKAFCTAKHALHAPSDDYEEGVWYPYVEVPERIEACLAVLETLDGVSIIEADPASKADLLSVHDRTLVEGLERISNGLAKGEIYQPHPFKDGLFADASAPVTRGTFEAARASAGCALRAALAVLGGDRHAIALCRPPGHHAGRSFCGGYCYFNNAALAAQKLLPLGGVGILDLDYHHGHGTQDIFYRRSDVSYASLHADPAVEYPYRWGFAREKGEGPGEGFNLNLPLAPDCGEELYLEALEQGLEFLKSKEIKSLAVSLGFDTHQKDPYRGMGLRTKIYKEIAKRMNMLGLPVVFIFEGGYALEVLGESWAAVIEGIQ